jgi:DNA-binding NarL/FixJ family response regulator
MARATRSRGAVESEAELAPSTSVSETPPAVATVAAEDAMRAQLTALLQAAGIRVEAKAFDVEGLVGDGAAPLDAVVIGCNRIDLEVAASIEFVRQLFGDARVVVVTSVLTRRTLRQALEAGADGVVTASDVTALAPAVRAVCAGLLAVPRDVGAALSRPALSAREKQVLGMVVLGFTNGEISRKLYVAESTVKSHLSSAFSKLGVHSRNEATALILDSEHGLGTGILAISEDERAEGERPAQ